MSHLLWWVFASIAIGGAIGTVTRRSPIASLLFLVVSLFSVAAIYVILGAHFIAAVQVIVYAGAILVLFLFVIMLLNLGHDYRSDIRGGVWIVAGSAAAGVVGWAIARSVMVPGSTAQLGGRESIEAAVQEMNAVGAIADTLFRDFVVAFELTSLLLLVAIVGAVLLAKRRV
ncbi:MAG TPA: NADH-quinone oxidoreductase subunit J [Longimicrobiales bacterium]|nr:NADH-quinone oxidoreductase subunit J [Longimicrobiales bacterium]